MATHLTSPLHFMNALILLTLKLFNSYDLLLDSVFFFSSTCLRNSINFLFLLFCKHFHSDSSKNIDHQSMNLITFREKQISRFSRIIRRPFTQEVEKQNRSQRRLVGKFIEVFMWLVDPLIQGFQEMAVATK